MQIVVGEVLDCSGLACPPHRSASFFQGHPLARAQGWPTTDHATLQVGDPAFRAEQAAWDAP